MDQSLSREFVKVMNNLRKLTSRCHPKGKIHPGEFMMLGAIHGYMKDKEGNCKNETGIKVGELSEIIHSTKPATSKMLNTLEDKGYIKRVTDSKDRRVVYIQLSDAGETIIEHAIHMMNNFAEHTIQSLGEEDARELLRLLNKLYKTMAEELKEKPRSDT